MENSTNTTFSFKQMLLIGGLCAAGIPAIVLVILGDQIDTGTLRVWAVLATMLVPVAGAGAWYARGALARAEKTGLDTGMNHTLDVVRAVRINTAPAPASPASPMMLPAPDFELVHNEQRVIDL